MADPRELAQKAIGMLQNALANSEARADELTKELATKPVSKDKLANKIGVLSHRLASVEEERQRWQREAEQLEEVLANERVKLDSLKKKLEIAESGPDKLTKKEINYWRANAEKVEEQIAAYKSRIGALKRELRERDEQLASGQPRTQAAGTDAEDSADTQAEVENLRQQIAGLNAVLADAHTQRQRLESDVTDMRTRLERADQLLQAPTQPDTTLINELELARKDNADLRSSMQLSEAELHDLRRARTDLSTEISTLKRELDNDGDKVKDLEREHKQVSAQLEEARTRESALQSALEAARASLAEREHQLADATDSDGADDETKAELERTKQEATALRTSLERAQAELVDLRDAREGLAAELVELQRKIETEQNEAQERASAHSALVAELQETRESLAERERQITDGTGSDGDDDENRAQFERTKQEATALRTSLERAEAELIDLRDAREGLAAELAELQRRTETEQNEAQERMSEHGALVAELEEVRAREAEVRAELDERSRAIAGQKETTQALNNAVMQAELKAEEALNQVAELQAELKEEKEYTENVSEQANGRLDQVNKLQDSVEEAEERLNDALWRLEKAQYFEKLVNRRKSLIASLIDALRTKNKAMVALKAGLDSLRTHKALVEETQQKLLVRMEALKNELSAAREKIKEFETEASTVSHKELSNDQSELETLQERLTTQAELIQSLEDELKTAKTFKRDADEKDGEVSQLQEELETKNKIVARLQSDLDEQQRKLSKLRGSDGETLRLKALTEQDKSRIDILERENSELRAMIESAEQSGSAGGPMTDERETELQAKIAELTESVGKWKKKYEFVSTEAPAAYQTQTAAEQ